MNGMIEKIDLEIQVPVEFPEKYSGSLVNSAELCAVKKHLETRQSLRSLMSQQELSNLSVEEHPAIVYTNDK